MSPRAENVEDDLMMSANAVAQGRGHRPKSENERRLFRVPLEQFVSHFLAFKLFELTDKRRTYAEKK